MSLPVLKTAERISFHYLSNTLIIGCVWSLLSCVGAPPIEEYTLARTALESARDSGASSISPGFYHKAEQLYREGIKSFQLKENDRAKKLFAKARKYAEKAENSARVKKFQSGEGFP